MDIYLASGNHNKIDELKTLLAHLSEQVVIHGSDVCGGMPPVAETADSFAGNATLKAEALLQLIPVHAWVLADDSGLEVAALNGAPGVHSARYAGEYANDADNNRKLLAALAGNAQRAARFVCCLVLLGPNGQKYIFEGICNGHIQQIATGNAGFGYDPLFVPEGYSRSFAELGAEVKNTISHRTTALRALSTHLLSLRPI